ncbi:hypothetical protein Micbo1qcDRAFT_223555, partial [Microdochium bolleyi]
YAINHLFLPPQLPQKHDYSQTCFRSLVGFVTQALQDFEHHSESFHRSVTKMAANVLLTFPELHAIGDSQVSNLLSSLGGCMLLQVTSQNAGMLINRVADDVHFERFELTSSNEPIVDTKGRLVRTFPGQAVAVPVYSLLQDDVMGTLVLAISKMSDQTRRFRSLRPKKQAQR